MRSQMHQNFHFTDQCFQSYDISFRTNHFDGHSLDVFIRSFNAHCFRLDNSTEASSSQLYSYVLRFLKRHVSFKFETHVCKTYQELNDFWGIPIAYRKVAIQFDLPLLIAGWHVCGCLQVTFSHPEIMAFSLVFRNNHKGDCKRREEKQYYLIKVQFDADSKYNDYSCKVYGYGNGSCVWSGSSEGDGEISVS